MNSYDMTNAMPLLKKCKLPIDIVGNLWYYTVIQLRGGAEHAEKLAWQDVVSNADLPDMFRGRGVRLFVPPFQMILLGC